LPLRIEVRVPIDGLAQLRINCTVQIIEMMSFR
jgi:hypothetical protein